MTLHKGQWVRFPKALGYAEGMIDFQLPSSKEWVVRVPELAGSLQCPESWLTPIEAPSNYPDAPKWNPTSEGHPMMVRHEAETGLVTSYTRSIERGLTEVVCWCPWTPMQVEGKMGRLRSGEHPQCPVHTKEGFLFGFIDYVRQTFKGTQTGEFLGIDANPDESTIETLETRQAGARFL